MISTARFPRPRLILSPALVLFLVQIALAWHCDGHYVITDAALDASQDSLPAFFLKQRSTIVHCSCDPDLFKQKWTPHARSAEGPEHYFDMEYLQGAGLPATREGYLALCMSKGIDPSKAGYLPYAVAEWTERLAVAFAEYRKWPANEDVHKKCGVYAGLLAHYAADLCQPLHLTVHYDGRVEKITDKSPQTGIHQKVDALAGKLDMPGDKLAEGLVPSCPPNLAQFVQEEMDASSRLVENVYALEPKLPSVGAKIKDIEVREFSLERVRASALFLATLYMTAWKMSARATLPSWHSPPG